MEIVNLEFVHPVINRRFRLFNTSVRLWYLSILVRTIFHITFYVEDLDDMSGLRSEQERVWCCLSVCLSVLSILGGYSRAYTTHYGVPRLVLSYSARIRDNWRLGPCFILIRPRQPFSHRQQPQHASKLGPFLTCFFDLILIN